MRGRGSSERAFQKLHVEHHGSRDCLGSGTGFSSNKALKLETGKKKPRDRVVRREQVSSAGSKAGLGLGRA